MNERLITTLQVLAILAIIIVVGSLGFLFINPAKAKAVHFKLVTLREMTYGVSLNSLQAESYSRLLIMVYTDNPQKRAECKVALQSLRSAIDQTIAAYEAIGSAQIENRQELNSFREKRSGYRKVTLQVEALLESGQVDAARRLLETDLDPAYQEYIKAGNALLSEAISLGSLRSKAIIIWCNRAEWLIAPIYIFALVFGFLLPYIYAYLTDTDSYR